MKNRKFIIPLLTLCTIMVFVTSCAQDQIEIEPVSSEPKEVFSQIVSNESENVEHDKQEDTTPVPLRTISVVIDDEKDENVSKANAYCAFESMSRSDLLYIERNYWYRTEMFFDVNPDHFVIDVNGVSPLEIIQLAEEEFPEKDIYYHCLFTSPSEEAFEELSKVLSFAVTFTETGFSELKYQSSIYLTRDEIELIQEKDIGNLLMDFDYVDDERYNKTPSYLKNFKPGAMEK